MRVLMAVAMAALVTSGTTTVLALAPAAADEQQTTPTVQPDPAAPGERIWVSDTEHCTSPAGTATSPALDAPITLEPQAHALSGTGTLRADLVGGTYTLTLHCGTTVTATLRIADAPHGATGSADDHLGIGDAALGSAFVLGGLGFGAVALRRRRRAGPHA